MRDPIEPAPVVGFVVGLLVPPLVAVPSGLVVSPGFVVPPSFVVVPGFPPIVAIVVAPVVVIAARPAETLELIDARAPASKFAVNSSGEISVASSGKEKDKGLELLIVVVSPVTEQPCVVLHVVLQLGVAVPVAEGQEMVQSLAVFVVQVDSSDFLLVS